MRASGGGESRRRKAKVRVKGSKGERWIERVEWIGELKLSRVRQGLNKGEVKGECKLG